MIAATEVEYGESYATQLGPQATVTAQTTNVQASAELAEEAGMSHQARSAVTRSLNRFASATRGRLLNIT